MSGVVAALEATQSGIKVELLEATNTAGGNGNFSDCVFTFGSPQQIAGAEKAGVTVTADQIIRSEIELYDYTIDGELWVDVIEHSADNTQWLLDAGATPKKSPRSTAARWARPPRCSCGETALAAA